MDRNAKGKGGAPHRDNKSASDHGVKQSGLREEPGDGNNDFKNHEGKNDHCYFSHVPRIKLTRSFEGMRAIPG